MLKRGFWNAWWIRAHGQSAWSPGRLVAREQGTRPRALFGLAEPLNEGNGFYLDP
jgi:hypothetical protein